MKDKETISGAPEMKIWVAFPLTEFPYLLLILNENVTMSISCNRGWMGPVVKFPPDCRWKNTTLSEAIFVQNLDLS